MHIRQYTSPNENLQFRSKLERCKPHKAACHTIKTDVINDVQLYAPVYLRIYCHKF